MVYIVAWCSPSNKNRVTSGTSSTQEDSLAEIDSGTPSGSGGGSGGAGSRVNSKQKLPWSEKQELEDKIEDLQRQLMQSKKKFAHGGAKAAAIRPTKSTDPTAADDLKMARERGSLVM